MSTNKTGIDTMLQIKSKRSANRPTDTLTRFRTTDERICVTYDRIEHVVRMKNEKQEK